MTEETEQALFAIVARWTTWVVVVGSLILGAAYCYLAAKEFAPGDSWYPLASLALNLIPNLIASGLLFLAASIVLREVQEMRSKMEQHALAEAIATRVTSSIAAGPAPGRPEEVRLFNTVRDVPWAETLAGSSTVDICVHYWGGWLTDHADTFRAIFDTGATVRIVLPNPENHELMEAVRGRFPEHDLAGLRGAILDTASRLRSLVDRSNHRRARGEVYYSDRLTWYCGVRCDHRSLVLSFYEHAREYRTQSPTLLIDLNAKAGQGEWFDKEFGFLTDSAASRETFKHTAK